MNKRQVKTSKLKIKEYWYPRLKEIGKIREISRQDFMANDICFACLRRDNPIERAHIIAHMDGGPDSPHNLHNLCKPCHRQSEGYKDQTYWKWFSGQTAMHSFLHDITRYSGISTQNIFNILMRSGVEDLSRYFGFEVDLSDAENTVDFFDLLKKFSKIYMTDDIREEYYGADDSIQRIFNKMKGTKK